MDDRYEVSAAVEELLDDVDIVMLLAMHQRYTGGDEHKVCVQELDTKQFVTWCRDGLTRIALLDELIASGAVRIIGGNDFVQ